MSESTPILGLDLGTCTCLASVIYQGKTIVAQPDLAYSDRDRDEPDHPGDLMPSVFALEDGQPVVGYRALEQLTGAKKDRVVVREVKREMYLEGKTYTLGGREFSPTQITAEYVKVLIKAVARELKLPVSHFKKAVVTVPADFHPHARTATKQACVLAGLEQDNVQLVAEPVAAAYSLDLHLKPDKKRMLMIDLGGGTFDVAIWEVGQAAGPQGFKELGRDGDPRLGGIDWDREIADWAYHEVQSGLTDPFPKEVIRRLLKQVGGRAHAKLFESAERAKIVLSDQLKENTGANPSAPIDFRGLYKLNVSVSSQYLEDKAQFDAQMPSELFFERTERLLEGCVQICERLFLDIKTIENRGSFGWSDLNYVYLAGGGSRLGFVQRRFQECWKKPPILAENPQHAVVKGAARLGELWRQGQTLPGIIGTTRYKRSIGLLVQSEGTDRPETFHPIIPRNQELPFTTSRTFPIRGNLGGKTLRLRFAEQQYHHDGPRQDPIEDMKVDDLPPPPPPGAPPENAVITIECQVNGEPTLTLNFRGKDVAKRNLGELPKAPKPPRHDPSTPPGSRNGSTPSSANGTGHPPTGGPG
jgi:molecular chaperone DnaK (HSP70)